jgi:hypothetical protein
MKRALNFCAVLCLLGLTVCGDQFYNLPSRMNDATDAVEDRYPSLREHMEAVREPAPKSYILLYGAGVFLLGFGVFVTLARRVR